MPSVQSLSHVWLLWAQGLQHTRLPCPSPTLGACSDSCPLSRWCCPTISSSCHPLLLPSVFPSIRVFSNESVLRIRWPKYWNFSFSISPSNEYSGLISFRIDWFVLLAVQGTLKSPLQHHSSKASILQCSLWSSSHIHTQLLEKPLLLLFSSSVVLTLWDPMGYSTSGFLVLHHLPEFAETHVHQVSNAIQSSHPLLSPSPPACNLSLHQGIF